MTNLPDLPVAALEHIVSFLERIDHKRLRKTCRACVEPVDHALTRLRVAHHAATSLTPGRFAACQCLELVLRVPEDTDGILNIKPWADGLPSLRESQVTLYVRQSESQSYPVALPEQPFQWIPHLLPALTSLQVDLHVEQPAGLQGTVANTVQLQHISRELCQALGQCSQVQSLGLLLNPGVCTVSDLTTIPDLGRLTKLSGLTLHMDHPNSLGTVSALTSLQHLTMSCRYLQNDMGATSDQEQRTQSDLGPTLAATLTALTHLTIADFLGDTDQLIQDLESLPNLQHLGLPGLSWHQGPVQGPQQVTLSHYSTLTSLAVDRLLLNETSPDMFKIRTLDVGLSVMGTYRLPHVLPNVETAQLRWLWEGALLKTAGWSSLRSLHLCHLGYGADWRLLRTLPVLDSLRLSHGTGLPLLQTLLDTTAELSSLTCLGLLHWFVPTRAHSHTSLTTVQTASGGLGTASNRDRASAVGASSSTPNTARSTQADNVAFLTTLMAAAQHLTVQGSEQDSPRSLAERMGMSLAQLTQLQRLEVHDCTPAFEAGLHACATSVGGLSQLRELRLTQQSGLTSAVVVEVVTGLAGLTRLELGACGRPGHACFRGTALRAIEDLVDVVWDEHEDAAYL